MPFKLVEGTVYLGTSTDIVYFLLGLLVGAFACAFFFLLFLGGF